MKTETSITIHNYKWIIKLVESNNKNLLMDDNEYHSGVTNFRDKVIYINSDLCKDSFSYTLYHELTHAFINSFGMLQVDWNDEIVADFVAVYIQDIMQAYNYVYKDLMESLDDWIKELKISFLN